MPWQAHIFVGERVHDYDEVRAVFDKLGYKHGDIDDDELQEEEFSAQITAYGVQHEVSVQFYQEQEGGIEFPVSRSDPYTDALVGIKLTQRYEPGIFNSGWPHGREEPFELDLEELGKVLAQVRKWWPDAKILMMDVFS